MAHTHREYRRRDRRPRLDASLYGCSGHAIHVIVTAYLRRPIFADDECLCTVILDAVREAASDCGVRLYAFGLMPDHLHIVLSVDPGGQDVTKFVWHLKRGATLACRPWLPRRLWQRSFYDHVLRKAEDIGELCRYVVENPVRAGLVHAWQEYRYSWLSDEV